MANLETFQAETAAWLEANCPPEMRESMIDEDDVCWGGKSPEYRPGQKEWLNDAIGQAREKHPRGGG